MNTPNMFEYTPDPVEEKRKEEIAEFNEGSQWTPEQKEALEQRPEVEAMPPESEKADIGSALVLLDDEQKRQAVVKMFSDEKGLDPIIKEIKDRVASEVFDVTTKEGRARMGSVARQIGSAKVRMEKFADGLTEAQKKEIKLVTTEKTRMGKEMDALRDSVLAERDKYEAIEQKRVAEHNQKLAFLTNANIIMDDSASVPSVITQPTASEIQAQIDKVNHAFNRDWQEFTEKAKDAFDAVLNALEQRLSDRIQYEKDQQELETLRAKQAEADRLESERKSAHTLALGEIVHIGTIRPGCSTEQLEEMLTKLPIYTQRDWQEFAEQAREAISSAENSIKNAIELEKRRAEDAETQRIKDEHDKQQKELEKVEADRKERHESNIRSIAVFLQTVGDKTPSVVISSHIERLQDLWSKETDWQEYAEQAKNVHAETSAGLKAKLADAQKREKDEADAAEAKRLKDIEDAAQATRDKEKAEEDKRKANAAHKRDIQSQILTALDSIKAEYKPEEWMVRLVEAIDAGKIPHISIKY